MACNEPLSLDTSPSYVRLVIPRGDDYGWFNCTIKDANDAAIDITSATFDGGIKKLATDDTYLAEVDAEVVSGAAGTFRWRFTQADIDALDHGELMTDDASQYVWNFVLIQSGGDRYRLYRGNVYIVA